MPSCSKPSDITLGRNNVTPLPLFGVATCTAAVWTPPAHAQSIVPDLEQEIRQRVAEIESKLIPWRCDIREHPELGEQETRTAGLVAAHLTKLGLEVKTGIAGTGVAAILCHQYRSHAEIPA